MKRRKAARGNCQFWPERDEASFWLNLTKISNLTFFISDYSESDYDDSLDEYIRLKSRADPFEKEFQYGAYQAIMNGKIPHIKLDDAGNKMKVDYKLYYKCGKWK